MSRAFLPAAGHDLLLPLYDPLWRLMGGQTVRATFIREAGLSAGQRILDIGCGTGSLPVQIAESVPGIEVTALDPDPKALARGARKAGAAGVEIHWSEGFADELPYADARFDRVVSSFMFHHLDRDVKRGMLREVRRVLAPGGELHLVDFGGQRAGRPGLLARLLHTHHHFTGNLDPELFATAGFDDVREISRHKSLFGRYAHVGASVSRASADAGDVPDVAEALAGLLAGLPREQQPLLIAIAERLAAQRYRGWAGQIGNEAHAAQLLACADREEEIARRIEALHPDAATIQREIRAQNPGLEEINRSVFAARPLAQQFAMQAQGERLGAATWRSFARNAADATARETLLACAGLEEESAAVLEALLAER